MKQEIKALQAAAAALGLVAHITFTPAGEEMVATKLNEEVAMEAIKTVEEAIAPAPVVEPVVATTPVVEPVVQAAPVVEPVVATAPAEDILAQGNAILGQDTFEAFSGAVQEPATTTQAAAADFGIQAAPAADFGIQTTVAAPAAPVNEAPAQAAPAANSFDLSMFG